MRMIVYYALTTITVVGFGDWHPQNNYERAFCLLLLLVGVVVFSFMVGNLKGMMQIITNLDQPFNEDMELQKFLA